MVPIDVAEMTLMRGSDLAVPLVSGMRWARDFVVPSEAMYDTLSQIIKAGSIPLYSISGPAAYMKLMIAYNQDRMSVKQIMDTNLYFETVGKNIR